MSKAGAATGNLQSHFVRLSSLAVRSGVKTQQRYTFRSVTSEPAPASVMAL